MLRSNRYSNDTALYIGMREADLECVGTCAKLPSRGVRIWHFLKGFPIDIPDNLRDSGGNVGSERNALQLPWSIWMKPKNAPIKRLLDGNARIRRIRLRATVGDRSRALPPKRQTVAVRQHNF